MIHAHLAFVLFYGIKDDSLSDPVRFKRQLYASWTQLENVLKPKVSEHLFSLVSGLLKVRKKIVRCWLVKGEKTLILMSEPCAM